MGTSIRQSGTIIASLSDAKQIRGTLMETFLKGEKGDKGDTGAKGDKGDTYTLTTADKQEIAGMVLPALPSTDGSYVLTVTISNGEPTYTWQLQS